MSTINQIFLLLSDGKPRSLRVISTELGIDISIAMNSIHRQWNNRLIARSKNRISEVDIQFRGRAGKSKNTRTYHHYTLPQFMTINFELKPENIGPKINKSECIRHFILNNVDQAFFSREIFDSLKQELGEELQLNIPEIMSTVRKMEKKRQVYVRGYSGAEKQTPFRTGFLITALELAKPIQQALDEAFQRTELRLQDVDDSENPTLHRVYTIHDSIYTNSLKRELTAKFFLDNVLNVSRYALNHAIERCLELYPYLKEIKIFNRFLFYYDSKTLSEADVHAQIELKKNWLRKAAGRWNRLGHNWEAIVGWFVDKFTKDVTFWSQDHRRKAELDPLISRRGMHPRRITLHLIKNVGDRKSKAEVDRVWEVTPTLFSKSPTIYVCEAKWSIITKKTLDDFFEVLRWSKEFGADSDTARVIKSGVVPIFAASAFSDSQVKLNNEYISMAAYAARLNIEIWTQARFNGMLREHGVSEFVTVQKICRAAADEYEVSAMLDAIWKEPVSAEEIHKKYVLKNSELFEIEKEMDAGTKKKIKKKKIGVDTNS